MIDKVGEILSAFGYRVTAIETDFSIHAPISYHISAVGCESYPCKDTAKIVNEFANQGFDSISIACRTEVDTHEQWVIGSRLPDIITGMTHHYLDVSITPRTMLIESSVEYIIEDNAFNLGGAL